MKPDDETTSPTSGPTDETVRHTDGFETICAHYAERRAAQRGAAAPALYQTSTFVYPDAESFETRNTPAARYYDYTRQSNPTTTMLQDKLARLEGGTWARCFSSGMGAITAAIGVALQQGAHVVAVADCYLPTRRFLSEYLSRFGVEVTYIAATDPQAFIAALRDNTRLIYLESPTSGVYDLIDLAPLTAAARERGIVTIHDNSWASPYFQQPLDLGCDMVVHSATKFIGGHSDTVGGVVVGRDDRLRERVAYEGEILGASIDPFAAWLLLRGLRTLAVRMAQHQRSGLAVAHMLRASPKVERVCHPGLESAANYAVGRRQLKGYAGVFSFMLHDQTRAATYRFMNRLRLFKIGCSWGGYESLVVGGQAAVLFNEQAGRPGWLIRLHCGLETTEDLVADVRQALED